MKPLTQTEEPVSLPALVLLGCTQTNFTNPLIHLNKVSPVEGGGSTQRATSKQRRIIQQCDIIWKILVDHFFRHQCSTSYLAIVTIDNHLYHDNFSELHNSVSEYYKPLCSVLYQHCALVPEPVHLHQLSPLEYSKAGLFLLFRAAITSI